MAERVMRFEERKRKTYQYVKCMCVWKVVAGHDA